MSEMVKVRLSREEEAEKWIEGMLRTPFRECKNCKGKTRAKNKCQYCNEQL